MGKNDQFGNRMKAYERCGTSQKLMYDAPVIARLDGRAFHNFCKKNFKASYDKVFNNMMLTTTEILVKETNALIGYTQSDEITLVFNNDYNRPMLFDGKTHKLNSVLASIAADIFATLKIEAGIYDRSSFDCRVYNVPDKEEACNVLLWREKDATRNSIFSLARTLYSHKELDNKSSSDLQEMIFQKGINWNDCPSHQKRGTYIRMETIERKYTPTEIESLPPKHEARSNPDLVVKRRELRYVKMPPFGRVVNKVEVIFEGACPDTTIVKEDGSSSHRVYV
jgi:tRNA(His) 5'-end guanylyltransferase